MEVLFIISTDFFLFNLLFEGVMAYQTWKHFLGHPVEMRYKLSELPTSQADTSRNRQIKKANITVSIKQTVHLKYLHVE